MATVGGVVKTPAGKATRCASRSTSDSTADAGTEANSTTENATNKRDSTKKDALSNEDDERPGTSGVPGRF
jgi:hypothetical protein